MGAAKARDTGLTPKQDAFAYQVVRLGHSSRAYRVAYENTTMSDKAVKVEVNRLMKNQLVVDRIEHFRRIAEAHLEVDIGKLAREMARVGFSRIKNLFDDSGNPIPVHMLPDDVDAAVESITIIERKMVLPVKVEIGQDGIAREVVKGKDKAETKALKASAKLDAKAEGESVTTITFVPVREKKITLRDKIPALNMMAKWKKMIDDKSGDGVEDPNDIRRLSDAELEQRIEADEAFLKGLRAARGKSKAGQAAERAKAESKG